MTITPYHQLEIRYSPIIDFSQVGRGAIAPFVKLFKRVGIDNEGLQTERINLSIDEELTLIVVTSDRIILRYEGKLENLIENNSSVQSLLFPMLDRIKKLGSFGNLTNFLAVTIFIKEIENMKEESIVEYFKNKYLTIDAASALPSSTDYALTLEKKSSSSEEFVNFGPYVGISDIVVKKFDLMPNNPLRFISAEKLDNHLIIEHKIFKTESQLTFSSYVAVIKSQIQSIKKI